eukprot:1449152-Pyramimonas_sp.AAC.1
MRTVLAFIASLPAEKPGMVFGYLPTKQGHLQMAAASRLSSKLHLAWLFLTSDYFRIENVVAVRLVKSIH